MSIVETSAILGNVGEFIGSIAVLATLIYLTVQVKHSRELLEEGRKIAASQVYQARVGFRIDIHMRTAGAQIAELIAKVHHLQDPEGTAGRFQQLTAVEQVQYRNFVAANIQVTENLLYQHSLGLIEEAQFVQTEQYVRLSYEHWDMLGLTTPPITRCYEATEA